MTKASGSDTDVLIVGAGPVGLTLACELRRRGVSCRLIDKHSEFPSTSRALGIQARTLEVFDDMGVVEPIISRGATVYGATFLQGERTLATVKLGLERRKRPDQPYRGIVVLNQARVEETLRERLGTLGGVVERSRELAGFYETADGVVATVSNTATAQTEEIHAAYLVGCDGAHSYVRKALGLTFEGSAYPEHFVLGDVEAEGGDLPLDTTLAWLHEDGMLVSFPFPEIGLRRLFAVVYPDEKGEVPEASLELFRRLLAERAGNARVRLRNAVWLSNYKVNRRMVNHYRKGRTFVAGDAAHIHSPSGGQGMNTGIQDAYNLGWKLALVTKGKGPPSLLDTYEEERLPVARSVLGQTDTNQRLFISNGPVARRFREHVLVPLMELPAVTDAIVYRGSELGINYRRSSLAQPPPAPASGNGRVRLLGGLALRRGPRAGDRAPDAPCLDAATGEQTTLFDQFRGPHFTLLLFGGEAGTEADHARLASAARRVENPFGDEVEVRVVVSANTPPAGLDRKVLIDPAGEAHNIYGARAGSLYLVRPDGYVGFRGQAAAAEPLIRYLDGLLASDGNPHLRVDGQHADGISEAVKRELRVMRSGNRSPIPLRIAKWVVFLGIARRLYGRGWFWAWVMGLPLAGLATHLLYRHKTRGWTRPWGGWKDVEAATGRQGVPSSTPGGPDRS